MFCKWKRADGGRKINAGRNPRTGDRAGGSAKERFRYMKLSAVH
jgi:hypothetical protein